MAGCEAALQRKIFSACEDPATLFRIAGSWAATASPATPLSDGLAKSPFFICVLPLCPPTGKRPPGRYSPEPSAGQPPIRVAEAHVAAHGACLGHHPKCRLLDVRLRNTDWSSAAAPPPIRSSRQWRTLAELARLKITGLSAVDGISPSPPRLRIPLKLFLVRPPDAMVSLA